MRKLEAYALMKANIMKDNFNKIHFLEKLSALFLEHCEI